MSDQTTNFSVTAPDGTVFFRSSSRLHYTHAVLRCERGAYYAVRWSQNEANAQEAARSFAVPEWVVKRGITFMVVPCAVVAAPEVRRYRATVRGVAYTTTSRDPYPYTFLIVTFYKANAHLSSPLARPTDAPFKPYARWVRCDEDMVKADIARCHGRADIEAIEFASVTIVAPRSDA